MIDFSCLLMLIYFCSAGLPRVGEIFSRVQRLSSSEMLRGRSEADTSSKLKPRMNMSLAPRAGRDRKNCKLIVKLIWNFCFRGEAFLKEKRKEIEWVGGRDWDSFGILIWTYPLVCLSTGEENRTEWWACPVLCLDITWPRRGRGGRTLYE